MLDLVGCAAEVQAFLEERGAKFAFIGGVANLIWGKPRFTDDVDLSVFTGFADEGEFIDAVLERFRPRHPEPKKFALQARVLLLVGPGNVGIDIGLGGFQYEEDALERASYETIAGDTKLRVISAEDLILMKAFAGRLQDWADIQGVADRQGSDLNLELVFRVAQGLAELKDDVELLPTLRSMLGSPK